MNRLKFFTLAIRDYKIGAISVSSRFATKAVTSSLPIGTRFVVEYGAGDGVITREILKHLPKDGRLIAVELNRNFWPILSSIKDKRLILVNEDVNYIAKDLKNIGLPEVDAVISGIPFSFLSSIKRKEIIENTALGIKPGGIFIVYQHSVLVLPLLKKFFKDVKINFEARNLPPYFILKANTLSFK